MTSQFDPTTFLNAETTEESVKRPPLPTDVEYMAVIGELGFKSGVVDADPTKTWAKFEVPLTLEVPLDVQQRLGLEMPTFTIRDGLMLDIKEGTNALDYGVGKNNGLRRYREATGLNQKGQPFAPGMLQGRQVRVKLRHEEYPVGSGQLFERVAAVSGM